MGLSLYAVRRLRILICYPSENTFVVHQKCDTHRERERGAKFSYTTHKFPGHKISLKLKIGEMEKSFKLKTISFS